MDSAKYTSELLTSKCIAQKTEFLLQLEDAFQFKFKCGSFEIFKFVSMNVSQLICKQPQPTECIQMINILLQSKFLA